MSIAPEKIAEACHEINRIYCESQNDFTQRFWADSEQEVRDSAINGVQFNQANPEATPEQTHENWLKVKEAEGWVYGEVKDVVAQTHPCMVPYDQLPDAQKKKDEIFQTIVKLLSK